MPDTTQVYSKDDADNGTLVAIHKDLKREIEKLNKWDAFDLEKSNPLTVEQQIAVNQKVFDILQPAIDAVETALAMTDAKFKDRS